MTSEVFPDFLAQIVTRVKEGVMGVYKTDTSLRHPSQLRTKREGETRRKMCKNEYQTHQKEGLGSVEEKLGKTTRWLQEVN